MALKWKKEDTELLISSMQQYPCLYNIRSAEYKDREKKAVAFNNVLEVMRNSMGNITMENIKQKWRNVRTQYVHEQRMIKQSGCPDLYIPKLWCFSQLSFLKTNTIIGKSDDNVKENDEDNICNVQTNREEESVIEESSHMTEVCNEKDIRSNQKSSIKIECLKFERNKCRICFQEDVKVDWNDCLQDNDHLTYKDCYYKYTQLDCFDGDNLYLSAKLCCNCSTNLENINAFISKAIESHNLLKERLALSSETTNFETILMSDADIDMKPEIPENFPSYESTSKEYLNEESDSWSITEDNATFIKQRRTRRKRKSIQKDFKQDDSKTSPDELQSYKANPKKPWEVPTCCSICPKVLTSKYRAIQHEKTHDKNRERTEICSECDMKFFDKVALKAHKGTHLENREKTRKCEFCDKAFYHTGPLNIHRRIHLGQMIQCSLCTKKYCRQIDLDQHMITHSAARINGDFKPKKIYFVRCDVCEETIRTTQYKSHSARHMNVPLAKCAICDKEFFSKGSCIKHIKKVHKKGIEERRNFVIGYNTTRYTNLFFQQSGCNIFTKE